MEISRTIRSDLSKNFEFITTDKRPELPNKRVRSRSPTPPPRSSSSFQLEKLKMSLDIDARQKKVEEFKRKLEEKKSFIIKPSIEMEGKCKRNIPEPQKKKGKQNCVNNGGIRPQVQMKNAGNQKEITNGTVKDNQDFKGFEGKINKGDGRKIKGFREEFPWQLLEEYPFFGSPERDDNATSIIKLIDNKCGRAEVRQAINRMVNSKKF